MNKYRCFFLNIVFFLTLGIVYGETLHLVTENYPPFNMSLDGSDSVKESKIIGISTEIIQKLFKRAKIKYTIQLYPWKRAYWMAENKINHGVYSTTRTAEREKLFKWVGPLGENRWVFFAKKEKNIKIKSLDDAKKYRIGGYAGDATAIYLKQKGFHLELSVADHINVYLISKNRIDLWATGHRLGSYYAYKKRVLGLEEVFMFNKKTLSIAFNKRTSSKLIKKLNRILQQMKNDGTIKIIDKQYR
ncbi:MAG: polar amino acid transport system substrate-binding protein [bacterium]|jgi:polar amino acid transport system substrate-binding protein